MYHQNQHSLKSLDQRDWASRKLAGSQYQTEHQNPHIGNYRKTALSLNTRKVEFWKHSENCRPKNIIQNQIIQGQIIQGQHTRRNTLGV